MARSTYIYVLTWSERVGDTMPVAARTVKRELVDYVTGLPVSTQADTNVWRLRDGYPFGERTHLGTGAEFLAKERP